MAALNNSEERRRQLEQNRTRRQLVGAMREEERQTGNRVTRERASTAYVGLPVTRTQGDPGNTPGYAKPEDQWTAADYEAWTWDNTDGVKRDNMYGLLDTLYQDKANGLWNPYNQATNPKMVEDFKKKYGLDVSVIDDDFWEKIGYDNYTNLLQYTEGSLSPKQPYKGGKEAQFAYDLWKLKESYDNTKAVLGEMDDIQKHVNFWVSRGLSDDEIKNKIDLKGYKNLTRANYAFTDNDKIPEAYTQPIYWGNYTIDGMIWKARNNDTETDPFKAAVYASQGKGVRGRSDPLGVESRDPASKNYHPYNHGMSNDNVAYNLGVNSITYDELMGMREEVYRSGDENRIKAWDAAYDAEKYTVDAEEQSALLNDYVDNGLKKGTGAFRIKDGETAEQAAHRILDSALKDGITVKGQTTYLNQLNLMDRGRIKGDPVNLNRSVDYRYEDVLAELTAGLSNAQNATVQDNIGGAAQGSRDSREEDAMLAVLDEDVTPPSPTPSASGAPSSTTPKGVPTTPTPPGVNPNPTPTPAPTSSGVPTTPVPPSGTNPPKKRSTQWFQDILKQAQDIADTRDAETSSALLGVELQRDYLREQAAVAQAQQAKQEAQRGPSVLEQMRDKLRASVQEHLKDVGLPTDRVEAERMLRQMQEDQEMLEAHRGQLESWDQANTGEPKGWEKFRRDLNKAVEQRQAEEHKAADQARQNWEDFAMQLSHQAQAGAWDQANGPEENHENIKPYTAWDAFRDAVWETAREQAEDIEQATMIAQSLANDWRAKADAFATGAKWQRVDQAKADAEKYGGVVPETDTLKPNFVLAPEEKLNKDGSISLDANKNLTVVSTIDGYRYTLEDIDGAVRKALAGQDLTREEQAMVEMFQDSMPILGGVNSEQMQMYEDLGTAGRGNVWLGSVGQDAVRLLDTAGLKVSERADLVMELYTDNIAAAREGLNLGEYYQRHEEEAEAMYGLMERVQGGIDQRAQQAEAEAQQAAEENTETVLDTFANFAATGTVRSQEELDLVSQNQYTETGYHENLEYLKGLDSDQFRAADDALSQYAMDYLQEQAQTQDGYLFYQHQDEAEAVLGLAYNAYAQDAKIAEAAGLTLDELYQRDGWKKNPEDVWKAAVAAREKMNTLTPEEQATAEEGLALMAEVSGGNLGVGFLPTTGASLEMAGRDIASGFVGFGGDAAEILYGDGSAAAVRRKYSHDYGSINCEAAYARDLTLYANGLMDSDPEKAKSILQQIDDVRNQGLSVFELGIDIDTQALRDTENRLQEANAETMSWLAKYGTEAEQYYARVLSSATSSAVLSLAGMAVTAMTGNPVLGTAVAFGPGAYHEGSQTAKEHGLGLGEANLYGMFMASLNVATEQPLLTRYYNFLGETTGSVLEQAAHDIVKREGQRGFTGVVRSIFGGARRGLTRLGANFIPEVTQEFGQNFLEGGSEAVVLGDTTSLRESFSPRGVLDTTGSVLLSTIANTSLSSVPAGTRWVATHAMNQRLKKAAGANDLNVLHGLIDIVEDAGDANTPAADLEETAAPVQPYVVPSQYSTQRDTATAETVQAQAPVQAGPSAEELAARHAELEQTHNDILQRSQEAKTAKERRRLKGQATEIEKQMQDLENQMQQPAAPQPVAQQQGRPATVSDVTAPLNEQVQQLEAERTELENQLQKPETSDRQRRKINQRLNNINAQLEETRTATIPNAVSGRQTELEHQVADLENQRKQLNLQRQQAKSNSERNRLTQELNDINQQIHSAREELNTFTASKDQPAPVVQEAPVEETVAQEAPVEETVTPEVPVEQAAPEVVEQETPVEQTVTPEVPVEQPTVPEVVEQAAPEVPVEQAAPEAPVEQTVAPEAPVEQTVAEQPAAPEVKRPRKLKGVTVTNVSDNTTTTLSNDTVFSGITDEATPQNFRAIYDKMVELENLLEVTKGNDNLYVQMYMGALCDHYRTINGPTDGTVLPSVYEIVKGYKNAKNEYALAKSFGGDVAAAKSKLNEARKAVGDALAETMMHLKAEFPDEVADAAANAIAQQTLGTPEAQKNAEQILAAKETASEVAGGALIEERVQKLLDEADSIKEELVDPRTLKGSKARRSNLWSELNDAKVALNAARRVYKQIKQECDARKEAINSDMSLTPDQRKAALAQASSRELRASASVVVARKAQDKAQQAFDAARDRLDEINKERDAIAASRMTGVRDRSNDHAEQKVAVTMVEVSENAPTTQEEKDQVAEAAARAEQPDVQPTPATPAPPPQSVMDEAPQQQPVSKPYVKASDESIANLKKTIDRDQKVAGDSKLERGKKNMLTRWLNKTASQEDVDRLTSDPELRNRLYNAISGIKKDNVYAAINGTLYPQQTIDGVQALRDPSTGAPMPQYGNSYNTDNEDLPTDRHGREARSVNQIYKRLAKRLGVGDYSTGTMPDEGIMSYYMRNSRYASMGRGNVNSIYTTMHELGHALQERLGIPDASVPAEIISGMNRELADAYHPSLIPSEAFAEFIRQYMENRSDAVHTYGEGVVTNFEEQLRNADVYDAVTEARRDLMIYQMGSTEEKVASHIHGYRTAGRLDKNGSDYWREFIIKNVDDTYAAARFDSGTSSGDRTLTVQDRIKLSKFSEQQANSLITESLRGMSGEMVDVSLAQAIGLHTKADLDRFVRYGSILNAIDRSNLADSDPRRGDLEVFNPTQLPVEDLAQLAIAIRTEQPEIAAAWDRYTKWWQKFQDTWMVASGLYTRDEIKRMRDELPNYFPTQRDIEETSYDPDARMQGSDEDLLNPLLTVKDVISKYVHEARINHTLEGVYDAMRRGDMGTGGSTGEFVREVEPGDRRAHGTTRLVYRDYYGNRHTLEFHDKYLADAIVNRQDSFNAPDFVKVAGKMVRGMSVLTTGSNPRFALKNAVRDFQHGVNHGSWATNYLTGFVKWVRAGYEVLRNSSDYQDYAGLGGGGFGRFGMPETAREGNKALRDFTPDEGILQDRYAQEGLAGYARRTGRRIIDLATLSRVNEVIEQTTRFAEYKFGKTDGVRNNLNSAEGRMKAFLNAQESTTNFSLGGRGKNAQMLRKFIPFYNATIQGTWSTVHSLSEAERDRLAPRLAKTAVNNMVMGALSYAAFNLFGDDDDREWYKNLSQDIKDKFILLPLGDNAARSVLRVPLAQDPTCRLFNYVGSQIVATANGDGLSRDLLRLTTNILGDTMQTDSILSPFIAILTNTSWNGSEIVPSYLEGEASQRYNASTPEFFAMMSRAAEMVGVDIEPAKFQYLFQQLTGFVGQMVMPAMSPDKYSGGNGWLSDAFRSTVRSLRNDWTIDPSMSNDIKGAYYDGKARMENVLTGVAKHGYTNMLDPDLTPEERQKAVDEANYLMGDTGPVGRAEARLREIRAAQNEMIAWSTGNSDLAGEDLYELLINNGLDEKRAEKLMNGEKKSWALMDMVERANSEMEKEKVRIMQEADGYMSEYAQKYMGATSLPGILNLIVHGGQPVKNPSNVSAIPVIYNAIGAEGHESLTNAYRWAEDYNENRKQKGQTNPTNYFKPYLTPSVDVNGESMKVDVTKELTEDEFTEYCNKYLSELEKQLDGFEADDDDANLVKWVRGAQTSARSEAEGWLAEKMEEKYGQ